MSEVEARLAAIEERLSRRTIYCWYDYEAPKVISQDVPWLIEQVRQLQAEIARLREGVATNERIDTGLTTIDDLLNMPAAELLADIEDDTLPASEAPTPSASAQQVSAPSPRMQGYLDRIREFAHAPGCRREYGKACDCGADQRYAADT